MKLSSSALTKFVGKTFAKMALLDTAAREPEPSDCYLRPAEVSAYAHDVRRGALARNQRQFVAELLNYFGNSTSLRIVDIGTGPGWIPIFLKSERPHWSVVGVDASLLMLATARENAQTFGAASPDWKNGGAHATGLPSGEFDVVLSHAAFHEFSNPEEALREMKRLLKPGGRLVIQDLRRPAALLMPFFRVGMASYYLFQPRNAKNGRQAMSSLRAAYTVDEMREFFNAGGWSAVITSFWRNGVTTWRVVAEQGKTCLTDAKVGI